MEEILNQILSEMKDLKQDIAVLKQDITVLKQDIIVLKEGQERIEAKVDNLSSELHMH
ncbi:hypothetical protein JK635_13815 [Neobacillus sp. YIM B02564]|jgi:outer membrane murein-binding lipoprotein Lpp|uniref:Uncharacterized protein n=1 Tax=Neobacillus paridis TaxID=2803862 RepID=A0ABS1TPS7_9BACI|nr:hypothetical protein [Neobacillus paridis]MBL4953287.1 hypothetical protein [Neobacillus paridis]